MPESSTALLITNLGSPESISERDIKTYLTDFLMDKHVVDYPYLFRALLVKGIIVPRRTPHSAEAYERIWTKEGSPLIILAEKLKERIRENADFPVALSMRYGQPSTEKAFQELVSKNSGLKEVIVLPLYPQYTMSSFGTAVEEIKRVHRSGPYPFSLRFLNPFYDHPDYIAALSSVIEPYLREKYDKILFSYHGIPERHLRKEEKIRSKGNADFRMPPVHYQEQARETTRLTAKYLNIPEEKYETSFQSRLSAAGKEWTKPYTANRLEELPEEGIKNLLVVSPAFVNDCLETLEELGMEGKDSFLAAGGKKFTLIPCINDRADFAKSVVKWVTEGQSPHKTPLRYDTILSSKE